MLKVGVIGIGNAGNQVADLAAKASFPAVAINTSANDVETVEVPSIIIGDQKGSGKDRITAKETAKAYINDILTNEHVSAIMDDVEVLAVVSSTGGGTGSGMGPVMSDILAQIYPSVAVITIGILPTQKESTAAQQNTLEYLQELRKSETRVYDLYDNERVEGNIKEKLETVNSEVIQTLCTIRGDYQKLTPYNSIDEKDMLQIIRTAGRLARISVTNFQEKHVDEKSLEDRLIEEIRSNASVEFELDKIVRRMGIIINMNEKVFKSFDVNIPKVKEYIGDPVEGFEHVCVDGMGDQFVHVLLSGLSIPDDRVQKILQQIDEMMSALSAKKESSILDNVNTSTITGLRRAEKKEEVESTVSITNIFDNY